MRQFGTDTSPRWFVGLLIVAIGVYAWVAAGRRPFTVGEEVMVTLPALLVFAGVCWPRRATGTPRAIRSLCGLHFRVVGIGRPAFRVESLPVRLLVTERAASHPERQDRRRGHERPAWTSVAVSRLARGRRAPDHSATSTPSMTSRVATFLGYGTILVMIGVWATLTARSPRVRLTFFSMCSPCSRLPPHGQSSSWSSVGCGQWHPFARGSGAFK